MSSFLKEISKDFLLETFHLQRMKTKDVVGEKKDNHIPFHRHHITTLYKKGAISSLVIMPQRYQDCVA